MTLDRRYEWSQLYIYREGGTLQYRSNVIATPWMRCRNSESQEQLPEYGVLPPICQTTVCPNPKSILQLYIGWHNLSYKPSMLNFDSLIKRPDLEYKFSNMHGMYAPGEYQAPTVRICSLAVSTLIPIIHRRVKICKLGESVSLVLTCGECRYQ